MTRQSSGAVSLVDQLVVKIRDAIVAGELKAGAHIGIKALADRYGVSIIPVREALARLLASRLVEVQTNRGYSVAAKPTPAEFAQFVQARELFELSAVRLGFENATPAEIEELRRLNAEMAAVAAEESGDSMIAWGHLNSEFHQLLVGLARNSYLDRLYADLYFGNLHVQLVRSYEREFASLELLIAQHDEIIGLLEAGDREGLLAALSAHIRNVTLEE
ncbi:MAG: GntR family transcriptional regulator [Pseudomonadota bacterium]